MKDARKKGKKKTTQMKGSNVNVFCRAVIALKSSSSL